MTNIFAMSIDLTNVAHVSALASIAQACAEAGIALQTLPTSVGATAPTPTQAQAPVPAPKERKLADTCDTLVGITLVSDRKCRFTTLDGKYLGIAGVRKAMNARIRNHAQWSSDDRAWVFSSAEACNKWIAAQAEAALEHMGDDAEIPEGDFALVTAEEWDAIRSKAEARKARKTA